MEKYFDRFRGKSEIETLINLYWIMTDEIYLMQMHGTTKFARRDWAVQNSMNNKKIKEFQNTMRSVLETVADHLRQSRLLDEIEPPSDADLSSISKKAIDLFKVAYRHNRFIQNERGMYENEHGQTFRHSAKSYCTDMNTYPCVIAAQVFEIHDVSSMYSRRMIALSVPAD